MMRTRAPDLLPLFRSRTQARLLTHLLVAGSSPASLRQLADELGVDPATLGREAARLERAGIVTSRAVGRARVIAVDEASPLVAPLRQLVTIALGPAAVLARGLVDVPGIEAAFVFGSWARRALGEAGPPPADVDLLVIGDPARHALARALRAAGEELAREVNPTVVSAADWATRRTPFLEEVAASPLVPITIARADSVP